MNIDRRSIGINFTGGGSAEVMLWAPMAKKAELIIHENKTLPLQPLPYGYWGLSTAELQPGDEYWFSVNGQEEYPDPASLHQARGVHGPSTAVNLNQFTWTDHQWKNIPLEEFIIYELHTGTFSPENNFQGIISRLDHLLQLGITAVEIMPVGQFPGSRNWGYDGVFPFAVQDSYGGPQALQQLVNACHNKGLAVILDVIYNHIGPEGNYLPQFGPYFTDNYHTPWGKALNFDDRWCNGARDFFIENALMWFRDFHIDALRLDAVHAIKDLSATHLLKEIRQCTDQLAAQSGRPFYLIAEIDLNDPKYISPTESGGYGADAQWIDEFHHALRVSAGQPAKGYYSDFNGLAHLTKSYNDAYVYDGQFSEHRKRFFGLKTSNPGKQFVVFSQNHDQTGNRMLGERTSALVSFEMLKLMAGAVLVSPFLPMLFMGEEWGETNPFLFFISHTDKELAALVNKGRKEEFSYFNWQGEPPDPRHEHTFNSSPLQWNLAVTEPHGTMLRYYMRMIALRKSLPALKYPDRHGVYASSDLNKQVLKLERWRDGQQLVCLMNFSPQLQDIDPGFSLVNKLMDSASPEWHGPAAAPDQVSGQLIMQPESILIYEKQ